MKTLHQSRGPRFWPGLAGLLFTLSGAATLAQEGREETPAPPEDDSVDFVVYLGAGSADDGGPEENDDVPWSIGFLLFPEDSHFFGGADWAGEGTVLDSTYGRNNVPDQATSINLIAGMNLARSSNWRVSAGVLLGLIQETADCPESYVGFRCYADEKPDVDFGLNYGGMLLLSYQRLTLGLRATGESTQAVLGFSF